MNRIIDKIKVRCIDLASANESADSEHPAQAFSVASNSEVDALEIDLGFPIPKFYRQLLMHVGNGGFGPGYGLAGTFSGSRPEGKYVAELYKEFRKAYANDPQWVWPNGLLPASHLGCGMYWCVDCNSGKIIWFEPNPHEYGQPWNDSFIPLANSIEEWFEGWLIGESFFEVAWQNAFPE